MGPITATHKCCYASSSRCPADLSYCSIPSFSFPKYRPGGCAVLKSSCGPPVSPRLEVATDRCGVQFVLEGFSFSSWDPTRSWPFLFPIQLFFPTVSLWLLRLQAQHPDRHQLCIRLSISSHRCLRPSEARTRGRNRVPLIAPRRNQPWRHLDFRFPASRTMKKLIYLG